jgi:hypothetical protein
MAFGSLSQLQHIVASLTEETCWQLSARRHTKLAKHGVRPVYHYYRVMQTNLVYGQVRPVPGQEKDRTVRAIASEGGFLIPIDSIPWDERLAMDPSYLIVRQ